MPLQRAEAIPVEGEQGAGDTGEQKPADTLKGDHPPQPRWRFDRAIHVGKFNFVRTSTGKCQATRPGDLPMRFMAWMATASANSNGVVPEKFSVC